MIEIDTRKDLFDITDPEELKRISDQYSKRHRCSIHVIQTMHMIMITGS